MDGTATINAKVDSLRLCGFVQNLGCAKPRLIGYHGMVSPIQVPWYSSTRTAPGSSHLLLYFGKWLLQRRGHLPRRAKGVADQVGYHGTRLTVHYSTGTSTQVGICTHRPPVQAVCKAALTNLESH